MRIVAYKQAAVCRPVWKECLVYSSLQKKKVFYLVGSALRQSRDGMPKEFAVVGGPGRQQRGHEQMTPILHARSSHLELERHQNTIAYHTPYKRQ